MIVEVTDGAAARYRGSLFYDLAKAAVIRLALAQAEELRSEGVAVRGRHTGVPAIGGRARPFRCLRGELARRDSE